MSKQTHRDLRAWQLAHAVRSEIVRLTSHPDVKRDFDFCDQAQRAANSACRNLAEGYGRYGHKEFHQFTSIARGSLFELLDSIDEADAKGYLSGRSRTDLEAAVVRAIRSVTALQTYLRTTPTPSRSRT